jgi:transcriptional regulator GlxA family with amidase domain
MSRSSFMAGFVEEHGTVPEAFVECARMHSAARLLHSSELPVECLAEAAGYASRSEFERTFEETFDVDPTAYRQRGGHWTDGNEVF